MLLIGNGRLITRDAQNHFFENGCVAIVFMPPQKKSISSASTIIKSVTAAMRSGE